MLNETNLSRMDLNLLVMFEVMAQELHVARTAARLNISPSAVSHGLARLRRTLHDPLFVKQPRGMVATDRALALVDTVTAILDKVREVMDAAAPFDPAASSRQFRIGTADGFTKILSPMIAGMASIGPKIDISIRHLHRESALEDLDARHFDLVIAPFPELPPRFASVPLYQDRFVLAMREGHPFASDPSLDNYCLQRHLLVAPRGDMRGSADELLAQLGRSRRVALAVPNFLLALDLLDSSDMVALLPESFIRAHAQQYRVTSVPVPFFTPPVTVLAVTPRSALQDAGLRWLFGRLEEIASTHLQYELPAAGQMPQ